MIKLFIELFFITFVKIEPSFVWDGTSYTVIEHSKKNEQIISRKNKSTKSPIFGANIRINSDTTSDQISPFITSTSEGNIYVVWSDREAEVKSNNNVRFSKSANKGLNWSSPNPLISDSSRGTITAPSIKMGGDNVLYTAWNSGMCFDKSNDYGETWGIDICPNDTLFTISSHLNCSFVTVGDTIYMAFLRAPEPPPDFKVYFVKSEDGGITWTGAKRISAFPPGSACTSMSLGIDAMNNLYIIWRDAYDIGFSKSTDKGDTWTNPVYNIPDTYGDCVSPPCLYVGKDGTLSVVWSYYQDATHKGTCFAKSNDTGATWTHPNILLDTIVATSQFIDGNNNNLYITYSDAANIYFTMSTDTGSTWSPKEIVNDTDVNDRNYPILDADEDGNIYIVWGDKRKGIWDIYFSAGQVAGIEVEDAIIPPYTTSIAPNPFTIKTNIQYQVKNYGKVTLDIYDIKGCRVKELVNETKQAGRHKIYWDGYADLGKEIPAGIYFLKLTTASHSIASKLIKLR